MVETPKPTHFPGCDRILDCGALHIALLQIEESKVLSQQLVQANSFSIMVK